MVRRLRACSKGQITIEKLERRTEVVEVVREMFSFSENDQQIWTTSGVDLVEIVISDRKWSRPALYFLRNSV